MKVLAITGMSLAMAASIPNVEWNERARAPEGISGGAFAHFSDKLVYAGGTTWRGTVKHWLADAAVYTISENRWSPGPPLPEPLAYGPFLQDGDKVEILGGFNEAGPSLRCWRLHQGAAKWEASGMMPAPTVFAKAKLIGGTPYVFGGCNDATDLRTCSKAVLKRTEQGTWARAGSMPIEGWAMPALAIVGDRAYLFGGCTANASGEVLNRNEAYSYDPRSNRWKALTPIPHAARGMTAVALHKREVLILGGVSGPASSPKFSSTVYLYDVARDRYEQVSSLPFEVMGMEALFHGGAIWGFGGEDKMRSRSQRLIEGTLTNR